MEGKRTVTLSKRARSTRCRYLPSDEEDVYEPDEEEQGTEAPTPFQRCSSNRDFAVNGRSSKSGHQISFTLSDREVLDCFVCFEPLKAPIFQCQNGHIICSSCCTRIKDKCPTCQSPFSSNRCRAAEKILASIRASCENAKYGCKESSVYSKKSEHESKCIYAPCSCPFPGCRYMNSAKLLYKHWSIKHKSSQYCFVFGSNTTVTSEMEDKFFVLQEREEGILFIVDISTEHKGSMVTVSCVAPPGVGMGEFPYSLSVETEDRRHSLRLESKTRTIQSCGDVPSSRDFLLVPSEFFSCSTGGKVNMVVRIERARSADN